MLLDEALLDGREILDDGVVLRDVSHRNEALVLQRREGVGYFAKRTNTAAREAERCEVAARTAGLATFVPAPIRRAVNGWLIFEAEPGAVDFVVRHRATRVVEPALTRALGTALGILHRETRLSVSRSAEADAPAVLSIHRPRLAALGVLSPATVQLTRAVQRHPALGRALDALREGWRHESLIHNDVKWANVLVIPEPAGQDPGIRIVDWEHSSPGDPAWDVGSAIAGHVTAWIESIPSMPSHDDPAMHAKAAHSPLHLMRPAIESLWEGYLESAGTPAGERGALLDRTTSFCGARLVRTAFEESEMQPALTRRAARHLQVAVNILDDPAAAADRLLGLRA